MIVPSSRRASIANGRRLSLTIRKAARLMDSGLVTSSQLSLFCHSMAVAGEDVWGLNAYNHLVSVDVVSEMAKESDERRRNEETLSVFDGIPISIKSNIADQSLPLTAGSAMLGYNGYNYNGNGKDAAPACAYDADTVRILLREKGGICMGSTSMDEFGMGSLGTNVPRGKDGEPPRYVKNPLPFLKHLRLDDSDDEHNISSSSSNNNNTVVVGEGRTGSSRISDYDDDERWASIVRLSPEMIAEKHREALESFRIHNNNNNEPSDVSFFYSAGGSSSGSAASVAHGSSLLSLGTDTGGSVRLPAAWCGLVGLKPSYGLLSRHGVVSYASSFDTVGILANSVDCAAAALDVLAQRNIDFSRDSTFSCYHDDDDDFSELSIAQSMVSEDGGENAANTNHRPLAGIKVGIPASFSVNECPEEIRESWSKAADELQRQGAEIVEISTESISPGLVQRALSAYYVLVSAEASSNLSRYDGFRYGVAAKLGENSAAAALNDDDEGDDGDDTGMEDMTPLERQYSASRGQGFGAEVSKRILCGASVLSSDKFHSHYEAAAKIRAALANEMSSVLDEQADILLIPTVLSLPPKLHSDTGQQQQQQSSSNSSNNSNNTAMFANDVMTVPASLAGLPAISIPVPITGEETFMGGIQLISSRLKESVLLKSAKALQ
jgi:aspartyl-tRNA(Asn)/glutamyl-tRNA(Gln) amidotransferase subunit A